MSSLVGSAGEQKTGCWGWSWGHCLQSKGSKLTKVKKLPKTLWTVVFDKAYDNRLEGNVK